MKRSNLLAVACLLVGGTTLFNRIAEAQTPDRILVFYSEIKVDQDRSMHVTERLQIANEDGSFDKGLHRRLWIKPAGPQRVKAGSFQLTRAKIDGHDAALRTTEDENVLDIEIVTESGTLPSGEHVVELSYTAKHQFAIYKNYEDLNQDISGEWPVPIEKATVEFHFPEALPSEAGLSTATGTDSRFQFDCIRTDLPAGVRFETTHALPAGNRLFISARFPHSGYFVSDFNEDGYRAVLENYPLLVPGLATLCGFIVFAAATFIVWRRVPKERGSTWRVSAEVTSPNFWREVIRIYSFPMLMFALAIIPGLNFTYSGHGGISWLFVPLCFPWVIVRILIKMAKGSEASRRWYQGFSKITVLSYVAMSLPLSWAAATSIRMTFGLPVSTWSFFAIMVSPFPWSYFT